MNTDPNLVAPSRHREYSFGPFTLNVDAAYLRRGSDEIPLRPKAFAVLAHLVEHHGRLVTKSELIDAVWPDAAVTDNSLAQCLLEVRRALNDEGLEIIRTKSRRGYIFAAPVRLTPLPFSRRPDDAVDAARVPAVAAHIGGIRRVLTSQWALALLVIAAAVVAGVASLRFTRAPREVTYTQLTDFTDSAISPAVSPDGRMLAFIRGSRTFHDRGQLYVKMLPDGEPVALTHDDYSKMAPVFSPDGSRIAYTVVLRADKWETWSVSVLGGEPQPMMTNAAALTWRGRNRVLFSEIKEGVQMGVVSATDRRSEVSDVYVPNGMAHRSSSSPDGQWVLVSSEMNSTGWLPCRLVRVNHRDEARIVGPPRAKCTYAAWSPDGRWMFFSAETNDGFHTWRQRFPDGSAEQVTFGSAEEEGIAMWPDGRSFASSVGRTISSIWIHDNGMERQITSAGYAHSPSFSTDGKTLYYLLRIADAHEWTAGELWAADLTSNKHRRLLPAVSLEHYDISDDGRIAFTRTDRGHEGIWIGYVDGRSAPTELSRETSTRVFFGPADSVLFAPAEGPHRYLVKVRQDGSSRQKISDDPIISLKGVSPNKRWAIVRAVADERRQLLGYPFDGGRPVVICEQCADSDGGPSHDRTPPALTWSPGGDHLYLRLEPSGNSLYETGKTYVVAPAHRGDLPASFTSATDIASRAGVQVVAHGGLFPGPRPSLYAYTRATTHRNIFRITLP